MISLICVILKKKSHRKKDQICDYQRQEFGGRGWRVVGELDEGGQKLQTSILYMENK